MRTHRNWPRLGLIFYLSLVSVGRADQHASSSDYEDESTPVAPLTSVVIHLPDPATGAAPSTPKNEIEDLRKQRQALLGRELNSSSCVIDVCNSLREVDLRINEFNANSLLATAASQRAAQVAQLPISERQRLLGYLEKESLQQEQKWQGVDLTAAKTLVANLKSARDLVGQSMYPPILYELKKDYEARIAQLTGALKNEKGRGQAVVEEKLRETKEKLTALNLIPKEELEKLSAAVQKAQSSPENEIRSQQFLAKYPEVAQDAQRAVFKRLGDEAGREFAAHFEAHVDFNSQGLAEVKFRPKNDFLKKQYEQILALTTEERGVTDEATNHLVHRGAFEPPVTAEDSLVQLLGFQKLKLDKLAFSKLVDRNHVFSGGVTNSGDDINLITLVAGPGRSLLQLSLGKALQALGTGAAFGAGFDLLGQAAESADSFLQGKGWRGLDPLRVVQSAAFGALVGPVAVRNPQVLKALAAVGIADAAKNALAGNYLTAVTNGVASLAAFKPSGSGVGDVVASDLHLAVKKTASGAVVLDTDHPGFKYLEAFVGSVKNSKEKIGKIILNGDYIDAPSLKQTGVEVTPELKAKLIAQVYHYIGQGTGKKVEIGLGNHDAIKEADGGYRGEKVAAALEQQGIKVFVASDIATAGIALSQKVNGKTVNLEASHKVQNFGPNLASLLPEGTAMRVLPDVVTQGNPISPSSVAGKVSSDIHQPILVEVANSSVGGQGKRFAYANSGALGGHQNAKLAPAANPTAQFEAGTFLLVKPNADGSLNIALKVIRADANGNLGWAETINPDAYVSVPWGGGIFPIRKVAADAPAVKMPSSTASPLIIVPGSVAEDQAR